MLICDWNNSLCFSTLRPRQDGCCFTGDIFKYIFLNENVWTSFEISPKFVPKVLIKYNSALVQIMAWRPPGNKPLSESTMVSLLTHICITRPQWVKDKRTFHQWFPMLQFKSDCNYEFISSHKIVSIAYFLITSLVRTISKFYCNQFLTSGIKAKCHLHLICILNGKSWEICFSIYFSFDLSFHRCPRKVHFGIELIYETEIEVFTSWYHFREWTMIWVSISWYHFREWISIDRTQRNQNIVTIISLTHWGRVTHICVSELTIIGSDNGLSPGVTTKPLSEPMMEYC